MQTCLIFMLPHLFLFFFFSSCIISGFLFFYLGLSNRLKLVLFAFAILNDLFCIFLGHLSAVSACEFVCEDVCVPACARVCELLARSSACFLSGFLFLLLSLISQLVCILGL